MSEEGGGWTLVYVVAAFIFLFWLWSMLLRLLDKLGVHINTSVGLG